jgi:hypothetical protein
MPSSATSDPLLSDPRQENLDPFEAADDGEASDAGNLGAKVKRRRRRSTCDIRAPRSPWDGDRLASGVPRGRPCSLAQRASLA